MKNFKYLDRSKNHLQFLFLFFLFTYTFQAAWAQVYMEGGKTRHRFAQLNLGTDIRFSPNANTSSAFINNGGQLENFQLKNQVENRFIIGGTHFWGHADFYVAIPFHSFEKTGFKTGVETGAKFYPWQIKNKKIRPYVGLALLQTQYQQGNGTELVRFKYPIITGITYNYKNHLLELGASYQAKNNYNYYINQTQIESVKTASLGFTFSYKYILETSLSAERNWQNGKTKRLTDTLASLHKLNGFTLAVGPSSTFFLKSATYNQDSFPFLDDHKSAVFPEFGLGYYWHQPDLQLNLAYRNIKSEISAYDYLQRVERNALTLEVYHFFADYHGFAVFAGTAASLENLKVIEKHPNQPIISKSNQSIKPGLVFGWDIRPNRLQAWYLRTNLRYFPNINVSMPSRKKIYFDQLEFNFIQLVIFPGRLF